MSKSSFHLDFKYGSPSEDRNPYHVRDGNWGGWGPPSWFVFPDIDQRNVFEERRRSDAYTWIRVWDDQKQLWRDITPEEHLKLPPLKDEWERDRAHEAYLNSPEYKKDLGRIMFPVMERIFPELITADIVGVQPMQSND